jgi:predicted dehydrogenase
MRAAIVGCGQIADAHIQEIRRVPGASVAAVCDANAHMAEQAATRFQVPGVYTDLARMLDEVKPDVVHITTPPASHLSIGRKVVAAGAHAYVEKPFTVNATEAEELIACAVHAGRLLCVGHSNALDESMLRLLGAFSRGDLGEAVHVEAVLGYNLTGPFGALLMRDPCHWVHRLPGGLAQNNLSHPLSLILPFIPDERPLVEARGLRWRSERFGDVRDRFHDELRVSLGGRRTTGSVLFSCRSRPVQLCMTFYGTKAHATASIDGRSLRTFRGASLPGPFARVQWAHREFAEARRELWSRVGGLLRARLHFYQGMNELISRFYHAIENGGELPIPMAEALRTTRIMDDIFRSVAAHCEAAS